MTPISICVIAKNEEKNISEFLERILASTKGYPVEIVIADTGSTDKTMELIQKFSVKLLHFDWINDFSAAKNFVVDNASNDWILALDCDEFIEEFDMKGIQQFISSHPDKVGCVLFHNHYNTDGHDSVSNDHLERLFDRKLYHYESIIHEQICRKDGSHEYERVAVPITVDHRGYAGTVEEMIAKSRRNDELLLIALKNEPDNPYLLFQLGQNANVRKDYELAHKYFSKALEADVDPAADYVKMLVTAYGYSCINLNNLDEALCLEGVYDDFCSYCDFVLLMGIIYMKAGAFDIAIEEFTKATRFDSCQVSGANKEIPFYNMGVIYEVSGNIKKAKEMYLKSGKYEPAIKRLQALK